MRRARVRSRGSRLAHVACLVMLATAACTLRESATSETASAFPYRIELQPIGTVQDTLFDYFSPIVRFARTERGELLVGPLLRGGETAIARVRPDLKTVERVVRRGFGPGEATGWYLWSLADNGALVIVAPELGRTQVFHADGSLRFSAPVFLMADGVGLCGSRVLMTGSRFEDREPVAGIFVADSETTSLALLHSLQTDTSVRHPSPTSNMLSVRRDRLIAAIPNRPEVAVSDSGCTTVKRVTLSLPWFEGWSGNGSGGPEPRPHAVDVQWYNDSIALLQVVRANPEAQVKMGEKVTDAPTAGVPNLPLFLGDLVAFHVESGRVLAHRSDALYGYRFIGANEVAWHRSRDFGDTELLTLRLVREQ